MRFTQCNIYNACHGAITIPVAFQCYSSGMQQLPTLLGLGARVTHAGSIYVCYPCCHLPPHFSISVLRYGIPYWIKIHNFALMFIFQGRNGYLRFTASALELRMKAVSTDDGSIMDTLLIPARVQ